MTADLQQQEAPIVEKEAPIQEAPSADTDPAQSPADAKPPEGEEGDKKTRRNLNAIQNRINELTREKHEERRARQELESQLNELRTQQARSVAQANEPRLEDFAAQGKTYDDFTRAMAKWEAKNVATEYLENFAKANLQTYEQQAAQEREMRAGQQFHQALSTVEQDGAKLFKDFNDVVANGPKLGPQMGQLVLSTERPAEISYYLAKNPEHALAIASLHPVHAARELGKLEAQFSKRVTSASAPPTTVGQSEKGPQGLSDDLPPAEWYRRRQAQMNRKS